MPEMEKACLKYPTAKSEAPIIKEGDFMTVRIFKRIRRFVWKPGEQDLALQQHFTYKSSKFSENNNSNSRINVFFNSRGLKLGHFGINFSMRSFHFWQSLSYSP